VYDPHRYSFQDASNDAIIRQQQEASIDQEAAAAAAPDKHRDELKRQQEQKQNHIQQQQQYNEHRLKLLTSSSSSQQQQHDPFFSDHRSLDSFSQNSRTSMGGGGGTSTQHPHRHRKSLHRKPPSLSQYQTTPISKHYEIAKQILFAFDSHWNQHLWVTAYAVGLQFVETVLLEIPKHGYFYASRHERERMESSLEAARVAQQLKDLLLEQQQQQQQYKKYPNDNHQIAECDNEEVVHDRYFIEEEDAGLVPNGDLQRVEKLLALALEQVEQASTDQEDHRGSRGAAAYESSRRVTEEELRFSQESHTHNATTTTSDWLLCEPLASVCCSDSFSNLMGPMRSTAFATSGLFRNNSVSAAAVAGIVPPYSPDSNYSKVSERYSLASMETNSMTLDRTHASTTLYTDRMPLVKEQEESSFYLPSYPVPVEPEAHYIRTDSLKFLPPPSLAGHRSSLSEIGNRSDSLLLEKALFLSGLEVSDPYREEYGRDDDVPQQRDGRISPVSKRDTHSSRLELNTLATLYHEDFDSLQSSRRVRISFVDTFQGRVRGSTNGCTVIAPLLCMHHLMTGEKDYPYFTGGDPGLPDSVIKHCIDIETPAVLNQLRSSLGLSETAFLIPSDAHDYLIKNEQLSQEQFKNVIGGNILDGNHLAEFISNLEKSDDRKIAATLFFHEHVVAILKLNRMDSQKRKSSWYDFIDSLPLKETLRRQNETSCDLCERLNLFKGLTDEEIVCENEMAAVPLTARIRCLDAESLSAVIQWYACSKFTDENTAYIDQYPWDDANCDFDPRVFQAFLWQAVS
jgi:hypothetical protein